MVICQVEAGFGHLSGGGRFWSSVRWRQFLVICQVEAGFGHLSGGGRFWSSVRWRQVLVICQVEAVFGHLSGGGSFGRVFQPGHLDPLHTALSDSNSYF